MNHIETLAVTIHQGRQSKFESIPGLRPTLIPQLSYGFFTGNDQATRPTRLTPTCVCYSRYRYNFIITYINIYSMRIHLRAVDIASRIQTISNLSKAEFAIVPLGPWWVCTLQCLPTTQVSVVESDCGASVLMGSTSEFDARWWWPWVFHLGDSSLVLWSGNSADVWCAYLVPRISPDNVANANCERKLPCPSLRKYCWFRE